MAAEKPGGLFAASITTSAIVFGIFTAALLAAISSGIKSSEVLVVSLYTAFSACASVSAVAALLWWPRFAPVTGFAAVGAAVSAYVFEDSLREANNTRFAFLLITIPLVLAIAVGVSYFRWTRRRDAEPRATVHRR